MVAKRKDDESLDGLYVGDFEGFIARRNELAKQLSGQGEGEAADRVRALKKPNRVAWAINQVSAGEASLRDELLDAGEALRDAQERLVAGKAESAELREASEQEQAAVNRALDAVGAVSEEAGAGLGAAAAERARQTLHAIARDEDVRREFERHRLSTDHDPAGLEGFVSLGSPSPARKPRGKAATAKDDKREQARRRRDELKSAEAEVRKLRQREQDAERNVEAARQDAKQAQRALERATKALDKAASDAAAASDRVDDLRGDSG